MQATLHFTTIIELEGSKFSYLQIQNLIIPIIKIVQLIVQNFSFRLNTNANDIKGTFMYYHINFHIL